MSVQPYDFRADALLKMVMFWGEWTKMGWKYHNEKFIRYAYNSNLTKEGKPKYHQDMKKGVIGDFEHAMNYLLIEYQKYAPQLMPHYTIICDNGYCGKGTGTIYKVFDTKPPKNEVTEINFMLKCICYTPFDEKKVFYSATNEEYLPNAMMSIIAQVREYQSLNTQVLQPTGYLYGGKKLYKFGEQLPKYPAFVCTKTKKIYYNGTRRITKSFAEIAEKTN